MRRSHARTHSRTHAFESTHAHAETTPPVQAPARASPGGRPTAHDVTFAPVIRDATMRCVLSGHACNGSPGKTRLREYPQPRTRRRRNRRGRTQLICIYIYIYIDIYMYVYMYILTREKGRSKATSGGDIFISIYLYIGASTCASPGRAGAAPCTPSRWGRPDTGQTVPRRPQARRPCRQGLGQGRARGRQMGKPAELARQRPSR